MSTTQDTYSYSEPTVTRTATESTIEFDVIRPTWTGWELIRITRDEVGAIHIDSRGEGPVDIPAQILPVVLAEIDRVVTADGETPLTAFTPVAASVHVAIGAVA